MSLVRVCRLRRSWHGGKCTIFILSLPKLYFTTLGGQLFLVILQQVPFTAPALKWQQDRVGILFWRSPQLLPAVLCHFARGAIALSLVHSQSTLLFAAFGQYLLACCGGVLLVYYIPRLQVSQKPYHQPTINLHISVFNLNYKKSQSILRPWSRQHCSLSSR